MSKKLRKSCILITGGHIRTGQEYVQKHTLLGCNISHIGDYGLHSFYIFEIRIFNLLYFSIILKGHAQV